VNLKGILIGKVRPPGKNRLPQYFRDSLMRSVALLDMFPHSLHDQGEVNGGDLRSDAVLFCFPDLNDSIRRIDNELCGDSTDVQAGAARWPLVYEGYGLVMGERVSTRFAPAPEPMMITSYSFMFCNSFQSPPGALFIRGECGKFIFDCSRFMMRVNDCDSPTLHYMVSFPFSFYPGA
jgi:hypothetical protein